MKKTAKDTMISPSIDELLEKVDNKYILSLLVAKRARTLIDGDDPLVDKYYTNKVTTSLNEIYEGKVLAHCGPKDEAQTEIDEETSENTELVEDTTLE